MTLPTCDHVPHPTSAIWPSYRRNPIRRLVQSGPIQSGSARKKNPRENSQGLTGGFRDNASNSWTISADHSPAGSVKPHHASAIRQGPRAPCDAARQRVRTTTARQITVYASITTWLATAPRESRLRQLNSSSSRRRRVPGCVTLKPRHRGEAVRRTDVLSDAIRRRLGNVGVTSEGGHTAVLA
jgi:hypothetical protein